MRRRHPVWTPAEVAALQRARAAEISGPWIMVLRHLRGCSLPELRDLPPSTGRMSWYILHGT